MGKAYPLHEIKFSKDKKIMVILKNGTVWYPSYEQIEVLLEFRKKTDVLAELQQGMIEMVYKEI